MAHVRYSILELFGQRTKSISIKFPLHKPPENLKMCYKPRHATACDFTVGGTYIKCIRFNETDFSTAKLTSTA